MREAECIVGRMSRYHVALLTSFQQLKKKKDKKKETFWYDSVWMSKEAKFNVVAIHVVSDVGTAEKMVSG